MTKHSETKRTESKPKTRRTREPVGAMTRPHDIPVIAPVAEVDRVPDQPFAEGAHDAIDSDLRQRMISETAYRLYAERGYTDGYDVDDWVQAEAEVDHLLLNPASR
jgi:predicted acyl esterase